MVVLTIPVALGKGHGVALKIRGARGAYVNGSGASLTIIHPVFRGAIGLEPLCEQWHFFLLALGFSLWHIRLLRSLTY
jgi:hypothetical protein